LTAPMGKRPRGRLRTRWEVLHLWPTWSDLAENRKIFRDLARKRGVKMNEWKIQLYSAI